MNAIITTTNAELYRSSTDAASICKDIVVATASTIQGRKYVCVEGWQAIAIAHGCTASSRDVERIDGGVRAVGEVRRMVDGAIISQAEGFVGEDENVWFGGGKDKWGKPFPKRADYAIRAMAQTRAISRACRSAFAHVVVMMNAGLQTTPAEEVPSDGFDRDNGDVIEHASPERVLNPATGRMVNPMSAGQAKKDGRGERAAALAHEVIDLTSVTECLAWVRAQKAEIETWPPAWQTKLLADVETHMDELREIAKANFGADDDGVIEDDDLPEGLRPKSQAREAVVGNGAALA